MGWRDKYSLHPIADLFPMMHGNDLFKLAEDIKLHGVRVPIGLYDEVDVDGNVIKTWLIDGRNRLEAAERAGLDIVQIPTVHVHCSDPVTWIIALNIRRRHLSKQQAADLAVACIMHAREAADNSGQDGQKLGRGRKPDRVKAAVVAIGKEAGKESGFSERTARRAIAKAKGKVPKPKPRRSQVEKERGSFITFLDVIGDGWKTIPEPSDAVLNGLTKDQNASGIEALEAGEARLARTRKRMQERG